AAKPGEGAPGGNVGARLGSRAAMTGVLSLNAFEQAQQPIALADLPIGSPLWNGVPEEEQRKYENSPLRQRQKGAPTSMAEELWNRMTGKPEAQRPGDTRNFYQRHAPTWAGGQNAPAPAPGSEGGPEPAPAPGAQGLPAPANDQGPMPGATP